MKSRSDEAAPRRLQANLYGFMIRRHGQERKGGRR